MGSSLGEISAAVASKMLEPSKAIEIAIEQAQVITENIDEGGMLAVISDRDAGMNELINEHEVFIASDNFNGHFIVTGRVSDIESFRVKLMALKVSSIKLPVKFPFHSPMYKQGVISYLASHRNSQILNSFPGSKTPFVSGFLIDELKCLYPNYFWEATYKYTNFVKAVDFFESKGSCFYVDLGPSGTSATFAKYNLSSTSNSQLFQIMTPYKRELSQMDTLKNTLTNS